jgi:Protein of unknown function (DUF3376)
MRIKFKRCLPVLFSSIGSGFGGFLKASWRANDIMWGRLDTVWMSALAAEQAINAALDFAKTALNAALKIPIF